IPETLRGLTVPIERLTPHPRNARQGDIGAISESLRYHGQFRPIVVNKRDNTVLAGNHTLAAARALGWEQIAATFVDVDDEEAARILLADNRLNDLATNNPGQLASLLQELAATPAALSGTGYDGDALDDLLADLTNGTPLEVALPTHADPTRERCPTCGRP